MLNFHLMPARWVRTLAHLALATLALGLPPAPRAQATAPGWPTVAQVSAAIQGQDADDTAARQAGAFSQLKSMITEAAGHQPPPPLVSTGRAYTEAITALQRQAVARLDPPGTPKGPASARAQWFSKMGAYERDPALREELLQRHLAPTLAATVRRGEGRRAQAPGPGVQQRELQEFRQRQLAALEAAAERDRRLAMGLVLTTYAACFGLAMGWRWFRSSPSQAPRVLRRGLRHIEITLQSGSVANHHKRGDTHVNVRTTTYTNSNTNPTVSVSSSVVVEQEFRLLLRGGGEQAVQISGADLPLFDGQVLTLVWGTCKENGVARLVRLVNHSARNWWRLPERRGPLALQWHLPPPLLLPALPTLLLALAGRGEAWVQTTLAWSGGLLLVTGVLSFVAHMVVDTRLKGEFDELAGQVLAAGPGAEPA